MAHGAASFVDNLVLGGPPVFQTKVIVDKFQVKAYHVRGQDAQ